MVEMSKKCVKKGENPYHIPNAKEASKYPFSKNNANTGTKVAENGGNWGKIRGKFARRARRANVLSHVITSFHLLTRRCALCTG